MRTYTETIDYSAQAAGRTFNTFTTPYSSNRIVLFLNRFGVDTTWNWGIGREVEISIVPTVINATHYSWTATVYRSLALTWFGFSDHLQRGRHRWLRQLLRALRELGGGQWRRQ